MTKFSMPLIEILQKQDDGDFLRAVTEAVLQLQPGTRGVTQGAVRAPSRLTAVASVWMITGIDLRTLSG